MAFIQNLQNKPEKEKKIILTCILGVIMILVFLIWIFQFKNFLKEENRDKNCGEDFTVITELAEDIKETYNNSVKEIDKIKDVLKEIN
ncbi:MAG: hypothetical protein KAJ58_02880 [Candidatus Pacebacteria bacterium]|nr:hypothetical protein [Candidatus Paceibacterota bacterium]MCK5358641.1 hypothetical protein [Elusimicrobiales bacterium]